jgi:hypothetical protein
MIRQKPWDFWGQLCSRVGRKNEANNMIQIQDKIEIETPLPLISTTRMIVNYHSPRIFGASWLHYRV